MSIPYTYTIRDVADKKTQVKEVKGITSFADNELLFEFKVYNTSGQSISSLNKFSIDLDQLKGVKFKKGIFNNSLIIESNKMAFLEPLPGSNQGAIKLKITRANKNEALNFSSKINLYLSQKKRD